MLILREDNPSVWREYQPGVRVKIKPLDKVSMRAFRKKATRVEFVNRQRQEVVNDEIFDHLVIRYVVEDWEGIVDPEGQAAPCTDENKDRVADKMINFSAWIMDEAMSLADAAETALEEDVKN